MDSVYGFLGLKGWRKDEKNSLQKPLLPFSRDAPTNLSSQNSSTVHTTPVTETLEINVESLPTNSTNTLHSSKSALPEASSGPEALKTVSEKVQTLMRMERSKSISSQKSLLPEKLPETISVSAVRDRLVGASHSKVSFRAAIVALSLYLGIGFVCYWFLGGQISGRKTNSVIDALYFSVVTLTTVGYGDIAPTDTIAKLFTCAFVFSGFFVVDTLICTATEYLAQKQEELMEEAQQEDEAEEAPNSSLSLLGYADHFFQLLPLVHYLKKGKVSRSSLEFRVREAWQMVYFSAVQVLWVVAIGVAVLHYVEGLSLVDALYCACVTVTTVGYGDSSFSTLHGRIFAIFWVLGSTVLVAHFFLTIVEARMLERQEVLARKVLRNSLKEEDLRSCDLDGDNSVSVAEYLLVKLKELGKLNDDDISMILEKFNEQLDADGDGDLDAEDVAKLKGRTGE